MIAVVLMHGGKRDVSVYKTLRQDILGKLIKFFVDETQKGLRIFCKSIAKDNFFYSLDISCFPSLFC